jgi:hypothetical protein
VTAPTLDELATLAPDPDDHDDGTVKVRVGDLRALVALIPAAREIQSVFGSYEPEQPNAG